MVCAFCVLMSLASNIWAQQAASAELQCDQTTIENHQDGCKTHKQKFLQRLELRRYGATGNLISTSCTPFLWVRESLTKLFSNRQYANQSDWFSPSKHLKIAT